MTRAHCEREEQTSAAIRNGTIDPAAAAHAQQCPFCSDILLVSEFLRQGSALTDRERNALPDATRIWQAARVRANQQAVHLALRPIRLMKVVAVLAIVFSPWLHLLLPFARELASSWSKTFDINFAFVPKIWPVSPNQALILLGFVGTTILLGLSSWYLVHQE